MKQTRSDQFEHKMGSLFGLHMAILNTKELNMTLPGYILFNATPCDIISLILVRPSGMYIIRYSFYCFHTSNVLTELRATELISVADEAIRH